MKTVLTYLSVVAFVLLGSGCRSYLRTGDMSYQEVEQQNEERQKDAGSMAYQFLGRGYTQSWGVK